MEANESPTFDLGTFVTDALPAMLDAEADEETWRGGVGAERVPRPATALAADDSPLTTFLSADQMPPEGVTRAERAEFFAARDAAQAAAVQAAQDAAQDHAHWVQLQQSRAMASALQGRFAKGQQMREEREKKGTTGVPVRDASKAPEGIGRW